jgi:D-xylose 1-dehydrogenase (NADP+, D-xylono-1,5-lactone-forming)
MGAVRWGVLGTGSMARTAVEADPSAFVAVASRDAARAAAFGLRYAFGSYEDLLASDAVDAVYVALPNALHPEWTVKALQAGKHVLCEKPFASTRDAAVRCFDAADAAGRLCTEGFMWRLHPQTTLARRLVADGAIGRLAHVRAALRITTTPGDVRRSPELGGGALSDLGCYCASAMRLFGGEPSRVYAEQVEDGVDMRFSAVLRLPDGVLGTFDAALDLPRADQLELVGTEGTLRVPDPWICRTGLLELTRKGETEAIPVDPAGRYGLTGEQEDPYRIEFETVSAAIRGEGPLEFGRADAIAQATTYEALMRSATAGQPVTL